MDNFSFNTEAITDLIIKYGPKLVMAIVVLLIGLWIIKLIVNAVVKVMERRNTDASLRPFFKSLMGLGLKTMLIISVMGMLGIQMTSFIAVLGAASLAIGMALSGSLQNFAGGVMLLIFKPFKVGDLVEAQGYTGIVKEIQIFVTILTTLDNKVIILPNGPLSTSSLTNYTAEPTRRVDFSFGIGYSDDYQKAKGLIEEVISKNNDILKDPAHFIALGELADSSVNITTRVWCDTEKYWDVYFYMMEEVKKTFDANGISIPFPQRDIHVYNH